MCVFISHLDLHQMNYSNIKASLGVRFLIDCLNVYNDAIGRYPFPNSGPYCIVLLKDGDYSLL